MPPDEVLALLEELLLVLVFGVAAADPLAPATLIVPFIPRPLWPSIGQYH